MEGEDPDAITTMHLIQRKQITHGKEVELLKNGSSAHRKNRLLSKNKVIIIRN